MNEQLLADNISKLLERVRLDAEKSQRVSTDIRVLAVSKTHPAEAVRAAFQCGLREFGESYLQEALAKIDALRDLPLCWHFIGPIQSNKTRQIASHFAWVHSVDRLKIAQRLNEQRPAGLPPLNVCLQVNTSGENTKAGISPATTLTLATAVAALPRLRLRGLMTIPAPEQDVQQQRQPFALLRQLLEQLNAKGFELDTLSMGMSNDLEAAILEGATLVRIGTAIFGPRAKNIDSE
jgi:pyridoxal phosphate enzyme (YggS family)